MPDISSGTTSKSTSSINFEAITNLTLHCLVTLSFSLSHTQPRGLGFGCGFITRSIFLTSSSDINFTWEPVSNGVSILVCLDTTHILNNSFLFHSSI
jgi:hypothetical protein